MFMALGRRFVRRSGDLIFQRFNRHEHVRHSVFIRIVEKDKGLQLAILLVFSFTQVSCTIVSG